MAVQPRILTVRRRERLFYIGIAVAILVTVFAGFSRSYFLKARFGTPELSLLLHVHGQPDRRVSGLPVMLEAEPVHQSTRGIRPYT